MIATQDGQVFEINEGGIFLNSSISLSLSAYDYNDVYNAPVINMQSMFFIFFFIYSSDLSRAFTLTENATLSLKGVSFVSGYFPEGGGVIVLNGNNILDIDNCLFLLNQAEGSQGGVIYSTTPSIITITASLFYNNTAAQGNVHNIESHIVRWRYLHDWRNTDSQIFVV